MGFGGNDPRIPVRVSPSAPTPHEQLPKPPLTRHPSRRMIIGGAKVAAQGSSRASLGAIGSPKRGQQGKARDTLGINTR